MDKDLDNLPPSATQNSLQEQVRILQQELERERARLKEQRELSNHLEQALQVALAGTYTWNPAGGTFVWSEGCRLLHDFDASDTPVTYQQFFSRVPEEYREDVEAGVLRARDGDGIYDDTYPVRWRDGSVHWAHARGVWEYNSDGVAERLFGIGMSNDEHHRVEAELKESESKLSQAQATAGIANWHYDTITGVAEVSEEYLRIHGFEETRYDFAHFQQFIPEEDLRLTQAALDLARTPGNEYDVEHRIIHAQTGEVRWLHGRGSGQFYEEGRMIALLGTTQDITARKFAEEEREQLQAALARSQQMEAIGTLASGASGVAHDFNNLLAAVRGYVDLARLRVQKLSKGDQQLAENQAVNKPTKTTGEIVEYLDQAEIAIQQARDVTHGLLAFARGSPVETHPINLNEIITENVAFTRKLVPASIAMVTDICDTPLTVVGDETQLRQVLINLVVNARDAMPDGGVMTVSLESREGIARIEVRDNGAGMAEDTLSRMFDPFFTTKPHGQGTGLGLSVVHGIVTSHQGHIHAASELGAGTRVVVEFPVSEEKVLQERGSGTLKSTATAAHILVVEDNDLVREACSLRIQASGYQVSEAADRRQARKTFTAAQSIVPVDLALIDVDLPDASGVVVCRELRKTQADLPVIYFTGNPNNPALSEVVVEPVLAKPLDFESLFEAIEAELSSQSLS